MGEKEFLGVGLKKIFFGAKRERFVGKAQASLETLILFAVALVLIGSIAGLAFDQFNLYYAQQQQKIAFDTVNSLAREIDDAYFISPGTVKIVFIDFPESADFENSHISGRELLIRVNGTDVVATTKVDVVGAWARKGGGYNVFLRAMEGVVVISLQSLEFYPSNLSLSIPDGSSEDFNLFITNVGDYSTTYDYSLDLVDSLMDVSSVPDFGEDAITILSGETRGIALTFSCATRSAGQYFGSLVFSEDYNLSMPLNVTCVSGQEKLSIFPSNKVLYAESGDFNSDSVDVCNNSLNNYSSSNATITGDIAQHVFTSFSGSIQGNSCVRLDLNITASSSPETFSGTLTVNSGGFSDTTELSLVVS